MGNKLEASVAILNGVLGDHLVRSRNGLATEMTWALHGHALRSERDAFARAYPALSSGSSRVVVLVHGVMTTENIWQWAEGGDYGTRLAQDFGYTPLYLRYNSGRPIADNGAELSRLLETLLAEFPVPIDELLLLGYSMGGLVIRSACHAGSLAGHAWLSKVQKAIYVGTPHRGAPLERAGRALAKLLHTIPDPYTRLIADVANLRSAGLKDLGDARFHQGALDAAAEGGAALRDPRHPVPLLASMQHYLIAGSLSREPFLAALFGDALVPVSSATNGACPTPASFALPPEHVRLLLGLGHLELPRHAAVYAELRTFCQGPHAVAAEIGQGVS
jgi:pimeloyl-ACP methyl ester carboxylesterase